MDEWISKLWSISENTIFRYQVNAWDVRWAEQYIGSELWTLLQFAKRWGCFLQSGRGCFPINVLFFFLLSGDKSTRYQYHKHYEKNWEILGIKSCKQGVPVVAQQITSPTRIHKNVGSIPSLAQWVKTPALPWAEVSLARIPRCGGGGVEGWQLQLGFNP